MNALRRTRGFSLIEVIAAILLLAVTFTALMEVAGGSIHLAQSAATHSEAAMWARSKLDSSFVMEPITTGETSGSFDDRYRWHLDVEPWTAPGVTNAAGPSAPGALSMYRLDLDVMWGIAPFAHHAHFITLRAARAQATSTPP